VEIHTEEGMKYFYGEIMSRICKIFSFIILLLFFCLPLFSQDEYHSFQIRPLVYLYNIIGSISDGDSKAYSFELSFEYQYKINNYIQISIPPSFRTGNYRSNEFIFNNGTMNLINYYLKETSYGIAPGIIIRPFGRGLRGFYIKPHSIMELHHIKISEYDFSDINFTIGFMGESGYQWILKNGFTIALGVGIGNVWIITDKKENYSRTSFIKLDFNFGLGFSF
jgi:hypothetical protein